MIEVMENPSRVDGNVFLRCEAWKGRILEYHMEMSDR